LANNKAGGDPPGIFKRIVFVFKKAGGYPPGILELLFVE
jgi:hypothetical protein